MTLQQQDNKTEYEDQTIQNLNNKKTDLGLKTKTTQKEKDPYLHARTFCETPSRDLCPDIQQILKLTLLSSSYSKAVLTKVCIKLALRVSTLKIFSYC